MRQYLPLHQKSFDLFRLLGMLALLAAMSWLPVAQAQSVAAGANLYEVQSVGNPTGKGCVSCHGAASASATNNMAANNPQIILNAIATNIPDMASLSVSATEAMSLALYIGQVKTPQFKIANGDPLLALRVRAGATGSKNIYAGLENNGTGGAARDAASGWSVAGNANASASHSGAGASMNYQVNYAAPSTAFGPASFTVTADNDTADNAALDTRTVSVNVIGITSAASVTGVAGFNYSAISPLYTATCQDSGCTGTGFTGSAMPAGLSVSNDGKITGSTTARGVFTLPIISGVTNGGTLPSDGTVSRSLQITLIGIDSGNPPAYDQGVPISTPYQVTTTGTIVAGPNAYSISALPAGMTFDTALGRLAGTPSGSGGSTAFLTANTTAGVTSVQVTITVNAANAPTAIASNLPAASVSAAGTKGTSINGANYSITATSGTPVSYSSTELAAIGLTVHPTTGAITGTPNTSGDIAVVLRASNIGGEGAPVNRTIRINPDTAPTVVIATPPNGNVGTPFPPFSVTANPPVIDGYAVASGSSLPPGLLLNAGTGAITGTPMASGVFKTRFTATNTAGTSPSMAGSTVGELTFTVIANQKPTISSPTFASFQAGVAIAPIQVVATGQPITAYRQSGLPSGLSLDTVSGIITGTPANPGVYAVRLSADNAFAGAPPFGPEREVQFTIGIPAPGSCAMSVPLNTPTTLDLATCLFGGFAPTGVSIVATPLHGAAVANGTRVTYTPVNNYFGADSFTFVGSGLGGTSPQGTVTVTVTGRPDPMQDPTVTRLMAAQSETAQRFAGAQIANFQRRMESLHRPPGGTAQPGLSLQPQPAANTGGFASAAVGATTPAAPVTNPSGLQTDPSGAISPQTPGGITHLAASHAPSAASESQVIAALTAGLGIQSMPLAENALSLIRNRSVNLAGVASGLGLNPNRAGPSSTSYWIEGVATFGTRDATGAISGSEFSSNGITVGVDRRYSDELALGMGLGYARDKTLIGTDGSVNRGKGYSLAVYGSYQPRPNTYIDALLGVASLDFDTRRFVAPMGDFAVGQRSGTQWFGSVTGGYEFRDKNLLLSPYGRLDFAVNKLGTSTETGAGAYALTYFDQTDTSVQGALGLRAESIHSTRFGYAVPRVRIEYRHEFKRAGQAYIAYADQVGGTRFAQAAAGGPRDSMALGLGSDFLLRDGLTLSVEYQLSHSFGNASTHALRLRLSKDFDVRGLPRLLSEDPESAHDEPINVQLEGGAVYDDNVTRAKAGADRRGDHSYALNVSKTIVEPLSANSRVLMTGTLGGEKFRRFNGLSRLSATAEAEYQYRASSDFDEPTFGAFARLTGDAFESSLRDGYRFSAGVSFRQSLTDRINVFAALSHNLRNASSEVFSTRDNSIRGNIDYTLSNTEILYLGAEYRRGDIVSTGRASLENVTVAHVFAQDDAYPGGQMFSYRFRGSTVLLTMGYNLALGPRDSIDFSWRHIRSTPGLRPGFVTSPRSYIANQLSAVYLMRF